MDIVPLTWKDRLDGCTVGQLIDLLREVAEELDSRGMPECAAYVQSAGDRLFHRWAGIPRPAATEPPKDRRSLGEQIPNPPREWQE